MKRSLFILALTAFASVPHTLAAVGDTVNTTGMYVADGVSISIDTSGTAVASRQQSTRLYDSRKGAEWTVSEKDPDDNDSLMCWAHASANSIEYWQSYYGVFAKPQTGNYYDSNGTYHNHYNEWDQLINNTTKPLPYGKIGVEPAYTNATETVPDGKRLEVARDLYYNTIHTGGTFKWATEWFLGGETDTRNRDDTFVVNNPHTGGYYSNYYQNFTAYTTIYSEAGEANDVFHNASTTFKDDDLGALKSLLLEGFGVVDGKQTTSGILPFIGTTDSSTSPGVTHFITCYGFTTDKNGNLDSIFISDNNDSISSYNSGVTRLYLRVDEVNGKNLIRLYRDKDHQQLWHNTTNGNYISEVSFINTPQVLKDMLAEYSDVANEAQIWNGKDSTWEAQVENVNELPTEATGWDINVDDTAIAKEHQGYYHTYSTDGRAVVFGTEGAANKTITINGTVKTSHITVADEGYVFQEGTDAVIAGATEGENASLSITSGASLRSEVALNLKNLTMESGATLSSSQTVVVTGAFLVKLHELQAANTYSLRNAAAPSASVDSNLDLSDATSITLEAAVNMNEHTLRLPDITGGNKPALTFALAEDSANAAFYNFSRLYFGDSETEAKSFTMQATEVFSNSDTTDLTNYFVVYDAKLHTLSLVHANLVPEPATATLSLLALAALAARRRRR